LAPLGIAATHLEIVLGCDEGGAARLATRERLRRRLAPSRVHAHDAGRGGGLFSARPGRAPGLLGDAPREGEGLGLVLAARVGAAGATLAGEAVKAVADAATRARVADGVRPLADLLPIDLALVIEPGATPRAWAGSGRWLLAERFPPGG